MAPSSGRGVVFDLDGVLVDSAAFHYRAYQRLSEELGVPISETGFRRWFGQTNERILPRLLGRDLESEEIEHLAERKEALFRREAAGRIVLPDGAAGLLAALRRVGFGLAVGTSAPRSNLDFFRRELGLDALVDAYVGAGDVRRGKPDPEVFLLAAERLGLAPGRCVVVEDAPVGVDAAVAAGMPCVALATTHSAEELRAHGGAALVLDRIGQLDVAVFEGLLG